MKKLYWLCLFLLAGCSEQHVEPLVFGANVWPGYEPAYLARELGYLSDDVVHLAEYNNSTEVIRAFQNGKLQVAALTLDEALALRKNIPDLRVFFVADFSNGADVLLARRGINNIPQLKGKRIGVEKTALGAYFLALILQANHLSIDDMHVVALPVDEHVAAFRTGHVDAVITFEPASGELRKAGAERLFDSSRVPGKIVDVLVARASDLDQHREQLRQLLAAWFHALHTLRTDTALAYGIVAQREHISPARLSEALHELVLFDKPGVLAQFSGNPAPLLKTAREIQQVLLEQGLLHDKDDLTAFIDASLVEEVELD